MKKRFAIAVMVAGLLFLVPRVFFVGQGLTSDDEMTALVPLARIPLDQLADAGSAAVIATIPNNAQWARIRRKWGDPLYFVGAVEHQKTIHCLDQVGIRVKITSETASIPLRTARGAPYGYSDQCPNAGLTFQAAPGTDLTIRATSPRYPMPPGELIVVCDWFNLKDKLVSIAIDEELAKVARVSTPLGAFLILAGVLVLVLGHKRPRSMDSHRPDQ